MQGGSHLKSAVLRKIERLVCGCVNDSFAVLAIGRYATVSVQTLYEGVTNIPLARRIARNAVFVVAHDRFGISYNELERHSGICCRSIIRSVGKYKDSAEYDGIVRKVNGLIDVELNKFPI